MDDPPDIEIRTSSHLSLVFASLAAAALALGGTSLHAQTPSADSKGQPMKQFVIIFRQGPHQLTEAELTQRAEETRGWARRQNDAGHKLDPHILALEGQWMGPNGESGAPPVTGAGSLTALLFLEARDLAEAVDIAKEHPGLRYGANVEVRPWAPPPPPPTAQP